MKKRELENWERAECLALKAALDAYNAGRTRADSLTQGKIADALGINQGSVSSYLNGYNALNAKVASTIAGMIGKPVASFSSRLAEEIRHLTSGQEAFQQVSPTEKVVSGDVIPVDFSRPGQVGDEVWIAHYDVRAAMGSGEVALEYPEMLQDVRVSPKHLREMGVEFKEHFHLKMVTGWGQSMAPTIKHRDPLLVDVTIREFIGDGIYLFSWQDHLYIKRLQISNADHFEMISDNDKHGPRTIMRADTYIHARVLLVWNAHLA